MMLLKGLAIYNFGVAADYVIFDPCELVLFDTEPRRVRLKQR
jgi:hypothetical protein